jgi:hypothetical protein
VSRLADTAFLSRRKQCVTAELGDFLPKSTSFSALKVLFLLLRTSVEFFLLKFFNVFLELFRWLDPTLEQATDRFLDYLHRRASSIFKIGSVGSKVKVLRVDERMIFCPFAAFGHPVISSRYRDEISAEP